MSTTREFIVHPDEKLSIELVVHNVGEERQRLVVVNNVDPTSICYAGGVRENDELVAVAGVVASTFSSTQSLDEFIQSNRSALLPAHVVTTSSWLQPLL
jgi:hypothetical protein